MPPNTATYSPTTRKVDTAEDRVVKPSPPVARGAVRVEQVGPDGVEDGASGCLPVSRAKRRLGHRDLVRQDGTPYYAQKVV